MGDANLQAGHQAGSGACLVLHQPMVNLSVQSGFFSPFEPWAGFKAVPVRDALRLGGHRLRQLPGHTLLLSPK